MVVIRYTRGWVREYALGEYALVVSPVCCARCMCALRVSSISSVTKTRSTRVLCVVHACPAHVPDCKFNQRYAAAVNA